MSIDARTMPDWHNVYQQVPMAHLPWYHPQLDPDVQNAVQTQDLSAPLTLWDLGTGQGNQAALLQKLGFEVTATDFSESAIKLARQHHPQVNFKQDDVLHTQVPGMFDIILDRGCFHVFAPVDRPKYKASLTSRLKPGGQYWLKCFSDLEPGQGGPYRYSEADLLEQFVPPLSLTSLHRTQYYGQLDPYPQAWFAVFTKP
jgi:2-polyprenyl-3-methyl-5-hydroxy-6-metoxy-1,4-benzoquinol methylase